MKDIFANTEKPFVWRDISEIIPTVIPPINEELKKDILENGMKHPLMLNQFHLILGGNERYAIFKQLNIKRIPVRYYHIP